LDLKLSEAAETIQAVVARNTGEQGVEVCETRWKDTWEEAKANDSAGRMHRRSSRNEEIETEGTGLNRPRGDINALFARDTSR